MRLVDASLPFRVVYSIYHHEYLGHLISVHYVQVSPNGQLSLIHQGAHPGTLSQFSEGIDEADAELIKVAAEIKPTAIVKRFGGNPRSPLEFFTKKFEGQIEKLALSFIQKQMAIILEKLSELKFDAQQERCIDIMSNDGYPAQTQGQIELVEPASVRIKMRRLADKVLQAKDRELVQAGHTRYYPTIFMGEEQVFLFERDSHILCYEPPYILSDKQLFKLTPEINGKKIKPFLRKREIRIPRPKEEEFYRNFFAPMMQQYEVDAKGTDVEVVEMNPEPRFSILVEEHNQSGFSFRPQVSYDRFDIALFSEGERKAIFEKSGDTFVFYQITRDLPRENSMRAFLKERIPNPNSLSPWELVDKDTGLNWLSQRTEELKEAGIQIIQKNDNYILKLVRPELTLSTQESGDWFDIKAVVKIGAFEIPFLKFRHHILKGNREYELPDGTIAILPEEWFSDYRHLLEVSELRHQGETMSIKRYQSPLLNFPSRSNGRQKMAEAVKTLDRIPVIEVPSQVKAQLRNYQQEGFNWLNFMKEHGMGGILADDMGLGKTLQTLTLLQQEYLAEDHPPSLIVLPTSLVQNWQNEARKFTPDLKFFEHTGINRPKKPDSFKQYNLIFTTYGIVRQDIKMLKSFPFHYVILDESQNIKNPESKTAKAVRKLVAHHRLSLTGTPIENTVMDVWSQMAFLNPGLLGSEAFFKKFYVGPIEKEGDAKRTQKLRRIIYPFILRRKKQQVEKELPPRIEKLHYCGMTERQKEWYEETRNSYRNYLVELINQGVWKRNKLNILTGLQKLRQIAIHPQMVEPEDYKLEESGKYLEIKRLLKQVIAKKRSKVLIFSQFVKMLHILRDDLKQEGIPFNYLDGSTKNRQEQVDNFQTNPEIQVFLISLKAGGVGLNLTAADYVFILDPWWNPAAENQAIDRSHRIGQKRTVFYYKFITQDSIEEKILALQQRKSRLSEEIISVEEDIYKSLDSVDLEALLS
jgi:SNF2 family DNA or RNA helicase